MTNEVQYIQSSDGASIDAVLHGHVIGQVTFVRIGLDKMIVDYTMVKKPYRGRNIGLELIRSVANMARAQHRHIVTLCPFARAMFNRSPEFDDVRLMNMH